MKRSLDQALPDARVAAAEFFAGLAPSDRLVVFCHFDADGLAAGALFGRGLRRLGFTDVLVVPSLRGESAFSEEARARLRPLEPRALIVTDLGVHRFGVLPQVPTLFVDHHRPEGEPAGAVVVSGYSWEPIPTSAWLAYELLGPMTDVSDLEWIASIGILSDLGDAAPWPRLAQSKKRFTAKWLREGVSLVNAARRASRFDVETPLHLLMVAEHPREISDREDLGAGLLRSYRKEVNEEMKRARRHAPTFSRSQPIALIRLHSACQIHPLIAQQWRGRLRDFAVIAANTGYVARDVAFSARTARADLNLPELFQAVDLGEFNGTFGHGHDQASGGHLPPDAFNRLLDGLGFGADAHVGA